MGARRKKPIPILPSSRSTRAFDENQAALQRGPSERFGGRNFRWARGVPVLVRGRAAIYYGGDYSQQPQLMKWGGGKPARSASFRKPSNHANGNTRETARDGLLTCEHEGPASYAQTEI